jgi:hypothetical protein
MREYVKVCRDRSGLVSRVHAALFVVEVQEASRRRIPSARVWCYCLLFGGVHRSEWVVWICGLVLCRQQK